MSKELIERIESLYPAKNKFADENESLKKNRDGIFAKNLKSGKEFIGTEYEKDEEIEGNNKV